MGPYSSSATWSSITPIPLNDGSDFYGQNPSNQSNAAEQVYPLATIAYPEAYAEATAYLRAVMAANEMSDRALELTTDVILMNPAHYTVWYV